MKKIVINLKPSNKNRDAFVGKFKTAKFYGSVSLGSKAKSYLISIDEYNEKKEFIKQYGTKAREQPFID